MSRRAGGEIAPQEQPEVRSGLPRELDPDEQHEQRRDDGSRVIRGEPNQSSLLPSSSTTCSAPKPSAMVAMPAQSPCRSSPSCIGLRSSDSHSISSITAPGTRLT